MKDIKSYFSETKSINESLQESLMVNEGFREVLKMLKSKFDKVFEYLKGVVVKVGDYFYPVDDNGEFMPAVTPLTAAAAYKNGTINKSSTFVYAGKEGSRIVGGGNFNPKQIAAQLYGSDNSLAYWRRAMNESLELSGKTINEVKLQNSDPQAKYNVIVDNDMLKKRIKMALMNKKLARLMIWGAPGIGKTAVLMNVLDEMKSSFPDYALIVKTLSNETPDNFTLPTYVETEDGRRADDIPKTWLPVYKPTGDAAKDAKLDESCGKGLLFIDELSRATPQVLNVMLPLINEGIFNGYYLGSGWTIVCASNRADDELSGQADVGNALANRFAQVYYEPTVKTWRKWADEQNFISPLLLQWLSMPETENMSGGKYYYMDPNEDMDDGDVTKLMCTPRSWTNAMRELATYSYTGTLEGFTIFDIDRDILAMTLNQYVPAEAVDSFLAFLEVISKIGNFDHAVQDVWKNNGSSLKLDKKSLNAVYMPLAQLICTAHADKLPTTEEFISFSKWLVAQNSDQLASYVLDVFKHTFAACVDAPVRDGMFILAKKLEKAGGVDAPEFALFKSSFSEFCNRWGVSFEDVPDYFEGLKLISAKYKEAFKSAVVGDHKDALG
jgi:hypothetical protein